MQQITLELGSDENYRPTLTLEREQQLVALMTQLIVDLMQSHAGEDYEQE
jgi:hypothetical protein